MMNVAIITGGTNAERDISLKSAQNVQNLLTERYEVAVFDFPTDMNRFLAHYTTFDVVIPLIHGKGGEDGVLQGFLETLGVPYLFSGVEAHAIALDKSMTKRIVAALGIATPQSVTIHEADGHTYQRPSVVKPVDGGSTIGIAVVRSQNDLDEALRNAFQVSDAVLVEDFVNGQEFTVAVVDDERGTRVLPVILIRSKDGFFDYESKYSKDALAEEICPAPISSDLAEKLKDIAVTAHRGLGCRQLSRTDIIVDEARVPWFLEINTIPGMTETSLVPKACMADGRDFADVLAGWIEIAACLG